MVLSMTCYKKSRLKHETRTFVKLWRLKLKTENLNDKK